MYEDDKTSLNVDQNVLKERNVLQMPFKIHIKYIENGI